MGCEWVDHGVIFMGYFTGITFMGYGLIWDFETTKVRGFNVYHLVI
jgi:hypothetical protein